MVNLTQKVLVKLQNFGLLSEVKLESHSSM